VSLAEARGNGEATENWAETAAPAPKQPGRQLVQPALSELVPFIDWTPFFRAWELQGVYPAILDDAIVGESARSLFADAQKMLKRIVDENWLVAKGVVGFWPCKRVGDDVVVYEDAQHATELGRFHFLRQQIAKRGGRANFCLADFVSPDADYIGGFAVTAGIGIEEHIARFEASHDDYSSIMLKALADRLAEAFAERLHQRLRIEFWGYANEDHLSNEDLITEKYRGIRPAPGYPACPDHTEKEVLFELLDASRNTGISLTESFAMYPTAAVSGWYFAHPQAKYFGLGKITEEQVADIAERNGRSFDEMLRWLGSVIN
jgi:5-methyltetrahydrofolate--homocysteine methyltransferase